MTNDQRAASLPWRLQTVALQSRAGLRAREVGEIAEGRKVRFLVKENALVMK
jgi:hypothetical protein